jgi:4-hydroxybenzoate polyprenyltransferase
VGYEQLDYFCRVKPFQKLLNFYIQSSFHVALMAIALTWLTIISFGISIDWVLLGFVFLATITGYNFVLYSGIAKWHNRSLPRNLKLIFLFSLIAFLAMGWFLLLLPIRLWWWILLTALLTLFYAVPAFPGGKNLRNVSGLKIGIIATVWSIVTVVFPLAHLNAAFGETELLLFLQRFLFIMALALPFEIRDLKNDALSLGTIPQRIGIKNTKVLGFVLLGLVGLLEFWLQILLPNPLQWTYLILIVTAVFLLFSYPNRSTYYTTFWVDGIPILWLVLELF